MRTRIMALAAIILLASATFTSSFAQTAAVSEKTFDWIFFAIVGIPFLLALAALIIEGRQQRLYHRDDHGGSPRSYPPFAEK